MTSRGMKVLSCDRTHTTWSADHQPVLAVDPGDVIAVETSFGTGERYRISATAADILEVAAASSGIFLTGPILVTGAQPGDAVGIEILNLEIAPWGYTTVQPGFGLLADEFPEPAFRAWDLSGRANAAFNNAVVIPLNPFLGTIGVAPPPGEVRPTIPPSKWGGNLDNRRLTVGTTLYLPVAAPGALLSLGDAHAAQGDGEVCGTAIETSALATVRITLHKGRAPRFPVLRTGAEWDPLAGAARQVTTGVGPDLFFAAQDAVRGMIDWLEAEAHLSRVEAYMLCSACVDLAIGEIVDRPNWVVSASLPLGIFVDGAPHAI